MKGYDKPNKKKQKEPNQKAFMRSGYWQKFRELQSLSYDDKENKPHPPGKCRWIKLPRQKHDVADYKAARSDQHQNEINDLRLPITIEYKDANKP